uniref:Uncharacterized protein n=1 Tax=Anguilla anguilla TaxID=7936 RepID=A0A0E9XIZ2_ANGAN
MRTQTWVHTYINTDMHIRVLTSVVNPKVICGVKRQSQEKQAFWLQFRLIVPNITCPADHQSLEFFE